MLVAIKSFEQREERNLYLRTESLLSCAGLMGYEKVYGFDIGNMNVLAQMEDVLWEDLIQSGMLEQSSEESGYRVSDLGQMILSMVCKPDAMVSIRNSIRGINRNVYIYHFYFLYIDEADGALSIDFLPNLEMSIGAYSRALEGIDEMKESEGDSDAMNGDREVTVFCESGDCFYNLVFKNSAIAEYSTENTSGQVELSEEDCTNEITGWILKRLKETEAQDE